MLTIRLEPKPNKRSILNDNCSNCISKRIPLQFFVFRFRPEKIQDMNKISLMFQRMNHFRCLLKLLLFSIIQQPIIHVYALQANLHKPVCQTFHRKKLYGAMHRRCASRALHCMNLLIKIPSNSFGKQLRGFAVISVLINLL